MAIPQNPKTGSNGTGAAARTPGERSLPAAVEAASTFAAAGERVRRDLTSLSLVPVKQTLRFYAEVQRSALDVLSRFGALGTQLFLSNFGASGDRGQKPPESDRPQQSGRAMVGPPAETVTRDRKPGAKRPTARKSAAERPTAAKSATKRPAAAKSAASAPKRATAEAAKPAVAKRTAATAAKPASAKRSAVTGAKSGVAKRSAATGAKSAAAKRTAASKSPVKSSAAAKRAAAKKVSKPSRPRSDQAGKANKT
ncbi:MAG: hypothetical protein M3357_07915 [Actinomycetota bacterium]|nr:hypothetical protein [Actinomycetota bacterium]